MALRVMSMAEMRLEVLLEAARSGETVTAICKRYGISRETFYVYRRRFQKDGIAGLQQRSKAPLRQPNRMAEAIEEAICRMRKDHPRFGARRIRAELKKAGIDAPATSSIHRVRAQRPRPGKDPAGTSGEPAL